MSTLASGSPSIKTWACLRAFLAIVVMVAAAIYFQVQPLVSKSGTCLLDDAHSGVVNLAETQPMDNFGVHSKESPMAELGLLQTLEQRCVALKKEFDRVQMRGIESLAPSVTLLQNLRTFDSQYVDAMSSFDLALRAHRSFEHSSENVTKNLTSTRTQRVLEMGISRRTLIRICFLQTVTKARQHAAVLPHEESNENGAFGCDVGMLSSVEARAVSEAESEEKSAGVLSSLGVYWSELAISGRSAAPVFGSGYENSKQSLPKWITSNWRSYPSAEMIQAELLLSQSTSISGINLPSLNAVQAQRLVAHADLLESNDYHSAAVDRYRKAANLAEKNGNAPLSSHALSKLSYSLKQFGSTAEALEAASKAVELTNDPLAQYVWASIRVLSGLLTTKEELKIAENQLKNVAGQLPTPEMEAQRQKLRIEMMMWSWVAHGDITKCTGIKDPARFLICTICKILF